MRIKLGSVAHIEAAGSGYGIGLDDDGHLVEFLGDWRALANLYEALTGPEPAYVELEDRQVLAVDDEIRLPLSREIMAERARFLVAAMRGRPLTP